MREPLPHVREDGRRRRFSFSRPSGVASARVQLCSGPLGLRANFVAYVVEGGGVMSVLRGRIRHSHLVAPTSPKRELTVGFAVGHRVAGIARVPRPVKGPDDLYVFPALPIHTNLVEGVDLSALNLVVDAHTILTIRILFAVGVRHDDTAPVAACLGYLPGTVLPALRVPVANQYVHRPRIDRLHTSPPRVLHPG